MANPEYLPNPEEPQPLSDEDLIDIATDLSDNKSIDFLASFTAFLSAGMSHEKALQMLGIDPAKAQEKLAKVRQQQAETLSHNVEAMRGLGRKALSLAAAFNPLRLWRK